MFSDKYNNIEIESGVWPQAPYIHPIYGKKIIQDFGMFDLVRKTFPNLEIHASTQMHIHNLDGTQLMEKLGMKRVVLARETSIDQIREIKKNDNITNEL